VHNETEDLVMSDCEECIELPEPVKGYLPFTNPAEPLVIFSGELRRCVDDGEVSAPGQITLAWKQQAHLNWSIDLDALGEDDWRTWRYRPDDGQARLRLDFSDTLRAEVDVEFGGDGRGWIPGTSVGDDQAPLDHVVAHWVNLPNILPATGLHEHHSDDRWHSWTGRWQTTAGGWAITIDARPDHGSVYREAVDAESFVITHTMDLRRSDGTIFTGAEAAQALSGLQYAISFAVGHWTSPAVPVGFAPDGTARWSEWGPLHGGRPRRGAGWWVDTRGDDLSAFLAAYFTHWPVPDRREPLRFGTTAAILAVETGFVEQRLLTAFAALEMLSWVIEVLEGGMDESKWRGKGSAWRLRRLLTSAKVDLTLSRGAHPGPLVQFARAEQQQDTPNALVLVRDRVTHPKNPRDLYRFKGLVAEASRLACRYLELVILHRIGYRGHIADRTKLGGWLGEADPAPWAK
jgi:hypothetical protein